MKRSIFFLVVGFGLGYAKAVSDQEDIRAAALTFQHFLLNLEDEQRQADEKQKAREAREAQKAEPEEEDIEDAVPVPDDAEPEPTQQGETP